jgi:hypothetical protein
MAPHDITTQNATSYYGVMLHPAQGSREVTSSNGEGAPSDVAIHSGWEGIKGGKKRLKQCLQGATITTDYDDCSARDACGSGMRCIPTTTHSDKHQARPPETTSRGCPRNPT